MTYEQQSDFERIVENRTTYQRKGEQRLIDLASLLGSLSCCTSVLHRFRSSKIDEVEAGAANGHLLMLICSSALDLELEM